jgi:hypothetical protein
MEPKGQSAAGRIRSIKECSDLIEWVDNIKMDLLEIGWGGMDWIGLAEDRDKWKSSCECGYEPSGSIKCWETIKWLYNRWPLSSIELVSDLI